MNLKQLEAFLMVAECRNFSKAADNLFLTQPTVSAHISSLENELDTRLFLRNTKDVTLSKGGEKLFPFAKEIISLQKEILIEFNRDNLLEKESIDIAASSIPNLYLLPSILSEFREKYSKYKLNILETDSTGVVEKILNNKADIGFVGTSVEKKHFEIIKIYDDELVVITQNNDYYKKFKNAEDIKWIKKEPFILREEGSGTRNEAKKQLLKLGIKEEDLNVILTIESHETIKRSVEKNIGIAIISSLSIKDEVAEGKLLSFPLGSRYAGRDINLIYSKNYHLSRASEKFINIAKKMYKKGK